MAAGAGGRPPGRAGSGVVPGTLAVALFDTPLLVAYRATLDPAMSFMLGWLQPGRYAGMTTTTAVEVLARSRDDEDRDKRRGFLANSVVVSTTVELIRSAEQLLWAVPLPTRLTADDAVAAVTAVAENLPLYSLDPDRYAGIPHLTVLPAR